MASLVWLRGGFAGWHQVLVGFVTIGVCIGLATYSFSVFAHEFAVEFKASHAQLMLGNAAMVLTQALLAPVVGPWFDRRPIRWFLVAGAVALALGLAVLAVATAMWQVIASYAVFFALAIVLCGPNPCYALVARWFDRRRGLALGVMLVGTSVGGFVLPPTVRALVDGLGRQDAFLLLAAAVLVIILPVAWWMTIDRPQDLGQFPDGADAPPAAAAHAAGLTTAAVLRSRDFWLLAVSMTILLGAFTTALSTLVLFSTSIGIEPARGAWLIPALSVTGLVGKVAFGVAADRIDLRACVLIAFGCTIVGVGLFCVSRDYVVIAAGCMVLGLAFGGGFSIMGAIIARLFGPENFGRVNGLITPLIAFASMVAPLAIGRVYDVARSYVPGYQGLVVLLVLAAALVPWIRVPRAAGR
ncbi:MAG: MFS transporter [Gammaproteobacteria bacterium]